MMHESKLEKADLVTIKAIAKILMGMCPESDMIEEMGIKVIGMVNDILKDWDTLAEDKKVEALKMLDAGLKNMPVSMRKYKLDEMPDRLKEHLRGMKES